MLDEVHHFGVTVSDLDTSTRFWSRTLRLPFLGYNVLSGKKHDRMYGLENAWNKLSWFQFGQEGMELFWLPRHPSPVLNPSPLDLPGYRYMGFWVNGYDEYVKRLEKCGVKFVEARFCGERRVAKVQDPDGIHILFFDAGAKGRAGVHAIKEVGLTVSSLDPYNEFFNIIGVEETGADQDYGFLKDLFEVKGRFFARKYGYVRLMRFDEPGYPAPEKKFFPYNGAQYESTFNHIGIRHIAFYIDDIREFYRRCRADRVRFLFQPMIIPMGSRMVYFLDPEGNSVEVIQIPPALRFLSSAAGNVLRSINI